LTEILRDRRTIVTLIVMPLLLYPLLTLGFGQFVLGGKVAEPPSEYRIGFESKADEQMMTLHLSRGLTARSRVTGQAPRLQLRTGSVPTSFENLEDAVQRGTVDIGLRPPAPAAEGAWTVIYREDSSVGRDAAQYVQELSAAADVEALRVALLRSGQRPPPATQFVAAPLASESPARLSLAVFVPLVLILMTMTGAVYPAIDLTAGERERGTLEVLIAAPVPRVSLLFGKYVAVLAVAVLTAVVNVGSMTVSLLVSGFAEQVFGPGGIRVVTLLEIFGLVLLLAAFFSAVLLVLTSFARSFKEAQAYLIPLMVVALLPGVAGLMPGLPLSGPLAVVPLLNIVLLARDLLGGHADPVSAAVVVISTAAYALVAVALAAQVFGAEGVLYGESGGWRALLRRGKG
jgi:ABC-2 type transport system permease protein/sodium transport system permease protein